METPKKRKPPSRDENKEDYETPQKKPRSNKDKPGFTPITTPTGTNRFIGKDGWMSLHDYAMALLVIFLFSTGLEENDVNSIVYGIEYVIDGVHYFKIGVADLLQNKKTSFGTKTGRIPSSLRTLGSHFEKVRIEKIHFVIKDDPERDLFKLLIESHMLRATKSSMVNPGAEIGLNLKEFRNIKNVAEYRKLAEKILKEHNLLGAVLQSP